jgi:hypothetical protein
MTYIKFIMATSLFLETLRHLIKEAAPSKQIEIVQEVLAVVNSVKRHVVLLINGDYGGFNLSNVCLAILEKLQPGLFKDTWYVPADLRDHPYLIRVVQKLGPYAVIGKLMIIKIELGLAETYTIHEYDGFESVSPIILNQPTLKPDYSIRPMEEVDAIIDQCIQELQIKRDPAEMEAWRSTRDRTGEIYKLR